ncbi:DUF7146 domain-containing protein [Roseobacter sp. S98]|uniref:DUF7146 domain-containing protein n=1 Tax=Roseobacter algicola (ex Choi et al. 2025) (nom. illeg.) TaxID=3092138 RepID=UPI003F5156E0
MSDALNLTRALGGRPYGRQGRAACPVCQAGRRCSNPSLSIADGADGTLMLHCFKGCSFSHVSDALRALGALPGDGTYRQSTRSDLAKLREAEEAEALKKATLAKRCWQEAQPVIGTLAEHYLRKRGIADDLPETLRFHPSCWHVSAKEFPALVARVEGADRFAIHRTYLLADGSGKAAVEPSKMMLGSTRGGAVRLSADTAPLVVAEGIETALSLPCLLHDAGPVWAALSTSGMAALRLPPTPAELIVAVDGEQAGREAGRVLAQRATANGWRVKIADPGDGLDFNDLLKREVSA